MMLNLICPNCGAENDPGEDRCQECGVLLIPEEGLPSAADGGFVDSSEDEQDLPDLLHALKHDVDISPGSQPLGGGRMQDPADLSEREAAEEKDVPEWLKRIRERAKNETDAPGEITQKISAAQESIAEGKSDVQHENFTSWIQGLHGESREEDPKSPPEGQAAGQIPAGGVDKPPEWLSKIRKVKGGPQGARKDQFDPEDKKGDSLLQWLVALEEGKQASQVPPGETLEEQAAAGESKERPIAPPEEQDAATRQIPVSVARQRRVPALDVSREEQIWANLFSSLVVDESAERPQRAPLAQRSSWVIRLVAALVLFGALSMALFGGWPGVGAANQAWEAPEMLPAFDAFQEEDSVLIVADYQAGFSAEIHQVAAPVFRAALQPGMEIALIATQPTAGLLSRQLLAELPGDWNLRIDDLGYYPSAALGAYAAGSSQVQAVSWPGLPKTKGLTLPTDLEGVFILADSYEGGRYWVEQLSARSPHLPLYLLVTAQAGPLLKPYQDSGQAAGMAAGISQAAEAEIPASGDRLALHWRAAYQVGTLLLAVMLILGAFLNINFKNRERAE